jgi:hypothetical protein
MTAGDGLGHSAERRINPAGIGEAFVQHLNLYELALIGLCQDSARRCQTRIDWRRNVDGLRRRRGRGCFVVGCIESQIGVACELRS